MSTLRVLPLLLPDFDTLISHAHTHPPGHDLIAPPTPLCYPVTTPTEAHTRLTLHFAKQRTRFLSDPSVHFMKVVLTTPPLTPSGSPEEQIISIARWHYYPTGYNYARDISWELHDEDLPSPPDFNVRLHNHILRTRDAARAEWIPEGEPCWILMHMVTHPAHRGKGAAGLLVRWGMERAEGEGVVAYLEAGVEGGPVYEGLGFERVGGGVEVRLREGGGEGVFVMARMRYVPRGRRGEGEEGRGGDVGVLG